jgi:hypothetical protein
VKQIFSNIRFAGEQGNNSRNAVLSGKSEYFVVVARQRCAVSDDQHVDADARRFRSLDSSTPNQTKPCNQRN